MKEKEHYLLISFDSTDDAIAFEATCPLKGRLIPLPSIVKAGCGLAWKGQIADKEALLDFLKQCRYHELNEI